MPRLYPLAVALVLGLVLGWSVDAAAQSPYGDDDGTYGEDSPFFRDPTPEPPPPPARAAEPESPYYLLPSEPTGPYAAAPQAPAAPQQWLFNGPHAINAQYGTGWCNVQGAHYHPYPPFDDHLFQEYQGGYYFLGDPTDFGYTGSAYWFNGPHPIATGYGFGWCYMPGAHRHLYAPYGAYYSMCGPYWCYGGPFDAWYWYYRPYYWGYWGSWYPRYYRGGMYYHTGRPASPGRFGAGHYGAGRPGAGTYGSARPGPRGGTTAGPVGRPGGYARPQSALPMRRAPVTLYHRLPANPTRAPMYRPSPYAGPRTFGPRQFAPSRPMPYRSYGTPRFGAPGYSAPRSFAPSRPSYSAPRFGGGRSFGGGGGRRR